MLSFLGEQLAIAHRLKALNSLITLYNFGRTLIQKGLD